MKKIILALLVVFSFTVSTNAYAMQNGQDALGDEKVVGIIFGQNSQRHCSGALLAPRIVATAAAKCRHHRSLQHEWIGLESIG